MRTTIVGILLAMATTASAEDVLSKYGKVYESRENQLRVEFVPFKQKNAKGLQDVLIKISGPAAETRGIDGKIIKHRAVHAGTGVNFQYYDEKNKKWYNRMGTRAGWWGSKFYEVWFGNETIKVWLNDNASSALNTKHFHTAFKQQR